MTNLEKKNQELGTNDNAEGMALRMLIGSIAEDHNLEMSETVKQLKMGLFYMYQYWLLSEAKEDAE